MYSVSQVYISEPSHGRDSFEQPGVFLSQTDLSSFFKVEEAFTQELTNYTKRLFFEVHVHVQPYTCTSKLRFRNINFLMQGIGDIAWSGEETRYDFLEITNPDLLLVTGEKENVYAQNCWELTQLKNL